MAETVLAMILFFERGLDFAVRAQARAHWDKEPFEAADTPVRELAALTVGIVGFGGIGHEVARRCGALGTPCARHAAIPALRRRGWRVRAGDGALDWLLAESDVVVLCLPDTDETRGLIDADALSGCARARCSSTWDAAAWWTNRALVSALRRGRLRGAGLDVFAREPLPPDSTALGTSQRAPDAPCFGDDLPLLAPRGRPHRRQPPALPQRPAAAQCGRQGRGY